MDVPQPPGSMAMASRLGNTVLRAALSAAGAKQLTDRELLAQFREGDKAAFEAIVKRHTGFVLGVCRRVLPIVQDAEDACQATFLILARKAKTGRWQSSIANWLYITARRVALSANRTAARRMKRQSIAATPAPVSTLDEMTGREAFAALDEELEKLSAIYREPLVLFYLQGLTRDEAAANLGIPSATLKSRLDRGRKKLADALTKRGIDIGAGLMAVGAASSAGASSQLVESILATLGGSPSASVAAIVKGVAMNGLLFKAKLLALATVAVAATGFGLASMQIAAGPQRPALARTHQAATKEDAKKSDKPKAEQAPAESKPPEPTAEQLAAAIEAYAKIGARHRAETNSKTMQITHIFRLRDQITDTDLKGLPELPFGFGLDLTLDTQVTDAGVKELKNLKNLTKLHLTLTQVTDAGVKELKELKYLNTLLIDGTQVTDAGMKELKDFKNLTTLFLADTKVTDAGMKEIKELKNLMTLSLEKTKVTDAGLKELKELKNLSFLVLRNTEVTEEGVKQFKETLPKCSISVNFVAVRAPGDSKSDEPTAEQLAAAKKEYAKFGAGSGARKTIGPTILVFTMPRKTTDADLKGLPDLPFHFGLHLMGNSLVTDAGMKELKGLKNLTELNLFGTQVTDAGLKEIKELKNLTELNLRATNVTDVGLGELKELKNLNFLFLGNTKVTDAGMKELKELKNLNFLFLDNTKVTDAGMKELKELKSLTTLSLWDTQVTDAGLKELKELKNLTRLNLFGTRVTDAGIKELKELKNLTILDLSGTQVTDTGLKEIREALPNCRIPNIFAAQAPADPKPAERKPPAEGTEEQLVAAKEAYAKFGAEYQISLNPQTRHVLHGFSLPPNTTDADLKGLPDLPFRFALSLIGAQVTDAGMKEIKGLKNLAHLRIGNTKVTDAGLKEIKELKNLTFLGLRNTKVTDDGLKELKDLKNLTSLYLTSTQVTDAGVKELKEALPNCNILR
jgi:RNA polymerase sigma factor (sigma-70 family)